MKRISTLCCFALLALFAGSCHSAKNATKSTVVNNPESTYMPAPEDSPNSKPHSKQKNNPPDVENREGAIVAKYASIMGVSKSDITNYKLYNFIDVWYGTPYKYAGRSKAGVDCSDLASLLFQSVYKITITGNVGSIYKLCKPIKASQLREGDLVFFKINSKSLSHVGVYLQNHRFVHASVHAGVVIDDLEEDYYKKYFYGAGRITH